MSADVTPSLSSGMGTEMPVAFRIASALRKITCSTAPSMALFSPKIVTDRTIGDCWPNRSTRPSRC